MHGLTVKQKKIVYIVAGAAALLLILGIVSLVVGRAFRREKTPEEAVPTPEAAAATAAPAQNTVSVAGKEVDPETDSFDLSGQELTAQDEEEIASLKNLTTLSLTNCGVSDLRFLSGLTKLRTLYLPDNRVNDLTPLAGLGELRTLYLDRNPLTDLTPLAELPALTMLSIQGVSIAGYVLADLQEAMPNCRIFADTVVEEARPISLGGLAFTEDVEVLDLSYREITDLSKLSYCLQLRELNLEGNPLENLGTLSGLPKLTVLHLGNAGLTDTQLETLQTLRRLTYLDLRDNPALTADGLAALEAVLPDCQIYHDTVYNTVTLGGVTLTTDMTEVDLTWKGLTSIEGLEEFTMLRRLVLYGNEVTDLSPLSQLRSLEELDLRYNRIKSLDALYSCTALRRVELGGNSALTADQIRRLQEALPACTIITDLDLSMPEPTPAPTPVPVNTPVPTPTAPAPIPEYAENVPLG